MNARLSRNHGFTLIEVMVTIIVVAFGLLGLASLVLRGLQVSSDSQNRTIAVKQTYDMADRMRTNQAVVNLGSYTAVVPSGSVTACNTLLAEIAVGGGGNPIVAAGTSTPACAGAGSAYEIDCWQRANRQLLPSGAGAICKHATENWYAIFVSWDESRSGVPNKTFWITLEP